MNLCEIKMGGNQKGSRTSQEEKVCISRWGKQDIYRIDGPLNEQSSHWGVEWQITCEKR